MIALLALSAAGPLLAQDRSGDGRYNDDRYGQDRNGQDRPGRDRYDQDRDDRRGDDRYGSETGFYRERTGRTVYYQYRARSYCGVQNEAQLRLLGSFNQVHVVNRLRLNGRNTGACSWPEGFYRRDNGPMVVLLQGGGNGMGGGRVCGISTPQQLQQLGGRKRVQVVPGNSDLEAGRQPMRPC